MNDAVHAKLVATASDRAQGALRSFTSTVDLLAPGLGSVFGELIGIILPANREERLAIFATKLDRSIRALDQRLDNLLRDLDAEQLALIEDGLRASARATQEARIERIGEVVAVGVVGNDKAARQREILEMLGQLTDLDIAALATFVNPWGREQRPHEPFFSAGQWGMMPPRERDAITERRRLRELSLQKITSLGLTEPRYGLTSDGLTGERIKVEEQELRLTLLGHFFCLHIGLWPVDMPPPSLT